MVAFTTTSPRQFEFPATTEQEARLYAAIVTNHYQLQSARLHAAALKVQLRRFLVAAYDEADGHHLAALRQIRDLIPETEKLLS